MNDTLSTIEVMTWHGCYDQQWRGLMTAEAFAHPAKFAPGLIDRIYRHGLEVGWWQRGSTIGDPFGGVAGGGIYAGYHGLGWVGVELEQRFVDLGNGNLSLHRAKWAVLDVAHDPIRLIQGDSRQFASVVAADGIVTSPPYNPGDKADGTTSDRDPRADRMRGHFRTSEAYGNTPGQIGRCAGGEVDAVITSPPYADGLGHGGGRPIHQLHAPDQITLQGQKDGYGSAHGQIGELPAGSVDGVITSPPYAETRMDGGGLNISNEHDGGSFGSYDKGATDQWRTTRDQKNLGNLPAGSIDAVVTSPPFTTDQPCASQTRLAGKIQGPAKRDAGMASPGNIQSCTSGNVDAVVTSPPYEDSIRNPSSIDVSKTHGTGATSQLNGAPYGDSAGQIGVVAGETYWQAMHAVYRQCWLAMKPGGVMAVVVKDYVKDKARVPLCDQTLRLLVHLGFEPVEMGEGLEPGRIHAMLVKERRTAGLFGTDHVTRTERKSFFRRLAEKKGSPRIDWEEVLVVRKAVARG